MDNYPPDAELVKAVLAGDKKAFDGLISRYYKTVFGYLYLKTYNYHSAEDVTQEVFLRAFRYLKKVRRDPTGFGIWLFTIARHCYSEWVRDQRRLARYKTGVKTDAEKLPVKIRSETDRDEKVSELLEQMKELPETYYLVLSLKYQKGLTCEEIAKALGQPIGTVTSNLSRAYQHLRSQLKMPQE